MRKLEKNLSLCVIGTYEFTEETFLNVKTEKDTEENLDKNEILKIISDYIEGTERFTDKSNSKS